MKNKAFMAPWLSLIYIGTVVLVQPYWAMEIFANFAYFNNINTAFYEKMRPLEALFRYGYNGEGYVYRVHALCVQSCELTYWRFQ